MAIASLLVGPADVGLSDLWHLLSQKGSNPAANPQHTILFDIRLPRVLAAALVGAGLAAAGACFQVLFRNPLASPDILGASAGAGLGACLMILLGQSLLMIQLGAFGFALVTVGLVILMANKVAGRDPVLVLILAGIVVGSLAGAGTAAIKIMADPYNELPTLSFWLLGGLNNISRTGLEWSSIIFLVGVTLLWLLRWRINLLGLHDDESATLGVNNRRLRLLIVITATALTASAVAISGLIGWVGLMVPHLCRFIVGSNFARLLPASLFMGAGFLIIIDGFARSVGSQEIPLGILTAVIGAPFFFWILYKTSRHSSS